jgi:hypothetical protein
MRKSHLNDEFLVLLGPIISRLFTCSNEEKIKNKKQRVLVLVLSLWLLSMVVLLKKKNFADANELKDRPWENGTPHFRDCP